MSHFGVTNQTEKYVFIISLAKCYLYECTCFMEHFEDDVMYNMLQFGKMRWFMLELYHNSIL